MCFRAPFLPPFFPCFSPHLSLQALFTLPRPLPSTPPLLYPPFLTPGKLRFRYPSDLGTLFGDWDRGGSNLRNLEGGGVKILNLQGPLKLTPFYRDSIEDCQFGGEKSKSSRGNFRGEFPPPLAFATFCSPLSRSPIFSVLPTLLDRRKVAHLAV